MAIRLQGPPGLNHTAMESPTPLGSFQKFTVGSLSVRHVSVSV